MSCFGLSDKTVSKIYDVFKKYHKLQKVIIYGSRSMGNYREGSDIDLTLIGDVTVNDLAKIIDDLDDLLLPYCFDVCLYANIGNEKLKEHIDRAGSVFYDKEKSS